MKQREVGVGGEELIYDTRRTLVYFFFNNLRAKERRRGRRAIMAGYDPSSLCADIYSLILDLLPANLDTIKPYLFKRPRPIMT